MGDKINLVAYCGLYCPKCYKMKVTDATELLKKELENAKDKGAKFLESFPSLEQDLDNLAKLRCVKFCREGGGKASCKIKNCCLTKNIEGCWQCDLFETCDELKEQFKQNIKSIRQLGVEKFIELSIKS